MTPMTRTVIQVSTAAFVVLAASMAHSQTELPPAARQTQADDYTRYELLDPASASFRILYEVTATTPGAKHFWNAIRKGSAASNESVTDPASGRPLRFVEVSGVEARANGYATADPDTRYIQIDLPRPVPKEGEIRLLIDKTYKDEKSYFVEEETGLLVFSRSLGIKRNSVVLPPGYEVVACSYPSQVVTEPAPPGGAAASSRLRLSFMNIGPDAVSYVVKARKIR
jgi:hypothetical protein